MTKPIIRTINQVRGPFNVSSPAIAAALAALDDLKYLKFCRNENSRLRQWLSEELINIGLKITPSYANFLLVDFNNKDQADAAAENLKSKRILTRNVFDYGLPKSLRMSIGKEEDCYSVRDQLKNFLEISNAI